MRTIHMQMRRQLRPTAAWSPGQLVNLVVMGVMGGRAAATGRVPAGRTTAGDGGEGAVYLSLTNPGISRTGADNISDSGETLVTCAFRGWMTLLTTDRIRIDNVWIRLLSGN